MIDKADDTLHFEPGGWNWGQGRCLVMELRGDGIVLVP
jgi:hypothetical protein